MSARSLRLEGRPAAPGWALGRVVRIDARSGAIRQTGSVIEEREALAAALAAAKAALGGLVARVEDADAQGILAFQGALIEDEALTAPAFARIEHGEPAEAAWAAAINAEIASYEVANDPYFRGRAADLCDLRDRVLRHLTGEIEQAVPRGAIVAAEDMPPSRFLSTDWHGGGLVLHRGSPTSHVAILAKARGVPMVVGVKPETLEAGREVLVDGDTGIVLLDPDPATRIKFTEARSARLNGSGDTDRRLREPAVTAAGEGVRVLINIAGAGELERLDPACCDGIGLVRTELMFEGRRHLPDEDEQFDAYRRIIVWAQGRPVTIRTLDAGGDKPIHGLTRSGEANPFLGVRGVRLSLRRPEVFRVQLRALARAAAAGDLKVMIPMVTASEEMRRCRGLMTEVVAELRVERIEARLPPLGMMVEVPAAALTIADFDADFYSIGSNDLIQYVAAASRDEPELSELTALSPAVLRLITEVVRHARSAGRDVSLCGDLGGQPQHVPALLDCGLRILSMGPSAVGAVKAAIARYGTPA
jgi:phosphoenolpyruvate-protein phosphotransferase (PTS system enzyme I)